MSLEDISDNFQPDTDEKPVHAMNAFFLMRDVIRVAAIMDRDGLDRDPDRWLFVGASILGSVDACTYYSKDKYGQPVKRKWPGLTYASLHRFAHDCRLDVTPDQLNRAISYGADWFENGGRRMRPETIGQMLDVTDKIRDEARAWGIVPKDMTVEALKARVRSNQAARCAARRAANGATPRSQSLARTKPWDQLGMSERTWYRRGRPMPAPLTLTK